MAEEARICFERIIPPAIEAAGMKFWPPGAVLRVSFLDGVPEVQQLVRTYAMKWTRYANIKFVFTRAPDPNAHIRISFRKKGSWSAVGKDALNEAFFPKGEPTMNYGWLKPESPIEKYSVVLHEFGHALGLVHEHQSPANGIQWNRRVVIQDLSGPPNEWNLPTIEHNVFNKYSKDIVSQFTKFDPASIMLYAFPSHWTLDGMQFPENKVLSRTDKEFIKKQYPK
jgi:matrixin